MAGRAATPQGRKLNNIYNMPDRRYLPSINFSVPFVACQNATILLAGVGGPRDPTIARGNIRSLLEYLELAR
jgi:hypothetical protein